MTYREKVEQTLKEVLGYTPAVLVLCPKDIPCDKGGCKSCRWGFLADKEYAGAISIEEEGTTNDT